MTKGGSMSKFENAGTSAKTKDTHRMEVINQADAQGTVRMEPTPSPPILAAKGRCGQLPILTIRPSRGWTSLDLREIWRFRDLLWSLASRDLKLRYKQTALGVIWVVLQPLMAAGIFSFVFGLVAELPSGGTPYLVFSFAGLLGWNLFSGVLGKVTGCLVGNSNLISKIYFPRLILPFSSVGSCLVDFGVAAVMMLVLLVIYRIVPTAAVLLCPIWLVVLLSMALGLGLVAAALSVSYRDVQYIMPVFTQMLLYASPVAYSVTAVPEHLRWIYLLNPITPPLEAIRSSLLGTPFPGWTPLAISIASTGALVFGGLYSFKRMEKRFADII